MENRVISPAAAFAVKDIRRHPAESFVLFLALTILLIVICIPLLFSLALSETADLLLDESPNLIVTRVNAIGSMLIPVEESLDILSTIPGVLNPRARIWGNAVYDNQTVTAMACQGEYPQLVSETTGLNQLKPGAAVTGPGVKQLPDQTALKLYLDNQLTLNTAARLPPDTALGFQKVILIHPADARHLFNIPEDYATDLAIDVFHEIEEAALIPELVSAFPWPVQILTKTDLRKAYAAGFSFRSGITLLVLLPAILGLLMLTAATVKEGTAKIAETGLLKALGWTVNDIVRLQLIRACFIGVPALFAGAVVSYMIVCSSVARHLFSIWFQWEYPAPGITVNTGDVFMLLMACAATVFIPFLSAVLWPVLKSSATDPGDLLNEGKC